MKHVIIAGAGIGGCAAAISFAQQGWKVTVIEKLETIFTEGAGILLYSNALRSIDQLGVLPSVLQLGASMPGQTEFLDNQSQSLGTVNYKSIDPKYPAYVGIDRQAFLEVLYNRAVELGATFLFDTKVISTDQDDEQVVAICDKAEILCDLFVVANGTNSNIRTTLWANSESVYSGFGLWHSMHNRHPKITEKVVVVMPDRRFGIIPIGGGMMYIWASLSLETKRWIEKSDQALALKNEFSNLSGFLKEIIDDINEDTPVHYTSVEEVTVDEPWHNKRIVLLGDAAHASLPFMAQGGAMALEDAVLLGTLCSQHPLHDALTKYKEIRKPVVDTVQQMCRNIGKTYSQSTVDLNKVQESLDNFYNKFN